MKWPTLTRTAVLVGAGAACLAVAAFGTGCQGLRPTELPAYGIAPLPSPAGDGSSAPFLTVAHGRMVLSWVERDASATNILFAELLSSGWKDAVTVATEGDVMVNAADVPSVRAIGGDGLVAAWLQENGDDPEAYDLRLTWSQDGGRTWSAAVSPHHDGTRTQHGFASLFDVPGGGLGVAWLDGRAMAPGLSVLSGSFSMALRAATYGPDRAQQTETLIDQRVCDCCPVSTAVTPDGVIVAFRDRSVDEIRDISVSRLVNGTWSNPMPVHRDGWKISACPVNGPSISAEGERVAVAWFSVEAGKGRTLAAFSTDAGRSFGSPVRVDEAQAAGRPQVVLLDDGAAAVSWVEFTDGRSQLKVRRIDGSGKRSPAAMVAEGMGAQHPRLARAGHDLVVAWVERGRVVTARAVESRSSN